MKSIFNILLLIICMAIVSYSQEKVEIKDSEGYILMEVNDEGKTGSISLKPGIEPSPFTDKFYNIGGAIYWNGSKLGTDLEAGGWTLDGLNLYPTDLSTNVGIGTMTPSYLFHVQGSSDNEVTMAINNRNNSGYARMLFGADPAADGSIILFGTSNTFNPNKFRFLNNRATGLFDWFIDGNQKMSLNRIGLLDVSGSLKIGDDGATEAAGVMRYNATSQEFEGYNGSVWSAFGGGKWLANGSDIYYNGGNVGVGTSTPLYEMQIEGNTTSNVSLALNNLNTLGNQRIVFGSDLSTDAGMTLIGASNPFAPNLFQFKNNRTGGAFNWVINDSQKMLLDNNGNLGIGVTTPITPLHIEGNSPNDITLIIDNTDNTGSERLYFGSDVTKAGLFVFGSSHATSPNKFRFVNNRTGGNFDWIIGSGLRMILENNGDLGVGLLDATAQVHINQTSEGDAFRVDDESGDTSPFIIDKDGNMGVGLSIPSAKSHIVQDAGGVDAFRVDDINDDLTPFIIKSNGAIGVGTDIPMAKTHIIQENVGDVFRADDDAFDTSPFVVKDNGDVGIGLESPSAKLDVDGRMKVGDDPTATSVDPGTIRYNSTSNDFEGYVGQWVSLTSASGINGPNQVTDIDGNVYRTVTIGNEIIMRENLKTSRFNDGTEISELVFHTDWINSTTPAWCWYENNSYYGVEYGKLYNWYSVDPASNGNKNVCPVGWHVPTSDEINILAINFLNGLENAADLMKEAGNIHWAIGNNATNDSGFTALPGGERNNSVGFTEIGMYSGLWTATQVNTESAYHYRMWYDLSNLLINEKSKDKGYSIRCFKD